MITLGKKFDILHSHYIEGKGIKAIAREKHLSKNTVREYIREFAEQKREIIDGGDKSALLLAMSEPKKYARSPREGKALTGEVKELILGCLLENERKKVSGQTKLSMKSTDIHEMLTERGYKISYGSVNRWVRELQELKSEAYIKQEYDYGEVCEFDWGEVKLVIGGKMITFRMAVFTLASSNIRYALLYRQEDTQAFVDSHIRFFSFIDRVPRNMVYDNMRVAIAKFVGKTEKIATIALKQLSTYYGFSYRFCNIRKGNEKGHVERSIEYVRRKAYSSVSEFASTEDANSRLSSTVERLNADKSEELLLEKEGMLAKMPDYSSVIRLNGGVDKFSTVVYKQNHYSVPDYLVGKQVEVMVYVDEIAVRYKGKEAARHKRNYESPTYALDIAHYRETLLRKPGAISSSLALKQSNEELQSLFNRFFADDQKGFILTLDLLNDYTLPQITLAAETLQSVGAKVQSDSLKMLLGNKPLPFLESDDNDEIEIACEAQLRRYAEVTRI